MVRKLTFGFAVLFGIVVALGYIPGFHTIHHGAAAGQDERLLFGLFRLTLIDDITHAVTAIAALGASLTSRRASLLFLTAFGFYYALDAIFYLTWGFFNDLTWKADIALNLPHVIISAIMLATVYRWAPAFDAGEVPVARPA